MSQDVMHRRGGLRKQAFARPSGAALCSCPDDFDQGMEIGRGNRHLLDRPLLSECHVQDHRNGRGFGVFIRRASAQIARADRISADDFGALSWAS